VQRSTGSPISCRPTAVDTCGAAGESLGLAGGAVRRPDGTGPGNLLAMTPVDNRPRRGALPVGLRMWLGLAFVLAATATVLAAVSVQVAWLRLGDVLGVWAALIGAFALAWSRRDVQAAESRTQEGKLTYQLELQREISARREHDVAVTEEARKGADNRHGAELAQLQEQLHRLNTTFSGLLDGDLHFERMTLSAESSRVRQVGDSGRSRNDGRGGPGQLESGTVSADELQGAQGGAALPVHRGAQSRTVPEAVPEEQHAVRDDDTVQFPKNIFVSGARPFSSSVIDAVDGLPDPLDLPDPLGRKPFAVEGTVLDPTGSARAAAGPTLGQVRSAAIRAGDAAGEASISNRPSLQTSSAATTSAEAPVAGTSSVEPRAVAEPTADLLAPDIEQGHTDGISVARLVAAYGAADSAPRRRRRAED